MKRVALIGHRGSGKTSLLSRIPEYDPLAVVLDLDREIEKRAGMSIQDIFSNQGESAFRALELATFRERHEQTFAAKANLYLALGAGFPPAEIFPEWEVWWVRRGSDEAGRIFTDRPRLDPGVSPLQEFRDRARAREGGFLKRADRILWIDEGAEEHPSPAERDFVFGRLANVGGILTLREENFKDFERWIKPRISWGFKAFEIRDDLLSVDSIRLAVSRIPNDQILFSHRDPTSEFSPRGRTDWPMEMGEPPFSPDILSLHERREGETLAQCFARFPSSSNAGLKATLPVQNFTELLEGELWRRRDPERRAFLPHSPGGRWQWYRLLTKGRQPLNFIREGDGSGPDQPTLLRWLEQPENPCVFAAVLGSPVSLSRTPSEQRSFFAPRAIPVFAIDLSEAEVRSGALDLLIQLGLRWAAVTAPLKEVVFERCSQLDSSARELRSVNTIQVRADGIHGTNTDLEGLKEVLADFPDDKIAVWGGGGTLNVIRKLRPEAECFSLRTGANRGSGPNAADFAPELVLWAVGRSRWGRADGQGFPPESWRPRVVVDLNYAEDSPGREYAIRTNSHYVSGLKMFRAQAAAQRQFWTLPEISGRE